MNQYSEKTFPTVIAGLLICMGLISQSIAQEQQFHDLGECPLESGEVIEDCMIGYRTVGQLNSEGSNSVLIPTWGLGTSEQVLATPMVVGSDGWVDPDRYFVVVIDAFGNGVSSSPSNSRAQPGTDFPVFTIADMVHAQYRLVTEGLGLEQVHGVAGVSLGAMATYDWAILYPDFLAHAVPVVGTPRRSTFDQVVAEIALDILADCEPRCEQARETFWLYFRTAVRSPQYWNRQIEHGQVTDFIQETREVARNLPDTNDILSQFQAGSLFDVSAPFDGLLQAAAEAIEAEMLIVVATHDMVATPEKSRTFAELSGAKLHESESDCGHFAFFASCDGEAIATTIREFLQ